MTVERGDRVLRAETVLEIVAEFDQILAAGGGIYLIVRRAAELIGVPVRLVDPERRLTVRVLADGVAATTASAPQACWPFRSDAGRRIWAETEIDRAEVARPLLGLVLERALVASRHVLGRLDGPIVDNGVGRFHLLFDRDVPVGVRRTAAHDLGLGGAVRAVVGPGGAVDVVADGKEHDVAGRVGIRSAVEPENLPRSLDEAAFAWAMTTAGTEGDPGPTRLAIEDLSTSGLIAGLIDSAGIEIADVASIERMVGSASWGLPTLQAIVTSASQRDAARCLRVHHSTLQERLQIIERELGWSARTVEGRLRTQIAMALHRAQAGEAQRPPSRVQRE